MNGSSMAWLCSLLGFVVLSGVVLWLETAPEGVLGLGRPGTLLLALWVLGFGSTALVVLHERTLRRRLVKSARREAERESIHRIAEVAAYELAQPLTVVMAYAQWLRRGAGISRESRYYLEQMVAACHEMSVILRNMYETVRHSRAQVGLTILDEPTALTDSDASDEDEELGPSLPTGGRQNRGELDWETDRRARRAESSRAAGQDEDLLAGSRPTEAGRRRT